MCKDDMRDKERSDWFSFDNKDSVDKSSLKDFKRFWSGVDGMGLFYPGSDGEPSVVSLGLQIVDSSEVSIMIVAMMERMNKLRGIIKRMGDSKSDNHAIKYEVYVEEVNKLEYLCDKFKNYLDDKLKFNQDEEE